MKPCVIRTITSRSSGSRILFLVALCLALPISKVEAQAFVNFGIYDVGEHTGVGTWSGPDGRIGNATDVIAIVDYLNGATGTIPTFPGTSFPTFDVTSTNADLTGGTRDNVISPLDALLIINHLNGTSFHQNSSNMFDVNDDTLVSPIDALIIINYVNSAQSPSPPILNIAKRTFDNPIFDVYPFYLSYTTFTPGTGDGQFLDVNGDNLVASDDALLVIAFLQ